MMNSTRPDILIVNIDQMMDNSVRRRDISMHESYIRSLLFQSKNRSNDLLLLSLITPKVFLHLLETLNSMVHDLEEM